MTLTPQETANIVNARWSVVEDGKYLPCTNLFDSDGNEITNPMRAASVVVYDESKSGWVVLRVHPGDVWVRREKEIKRLQ